MRYTVAMTRHISNRISNLILVLFLFFEGLCVLSCDCNNNESRLHGKDFVGKPSANTSTKRQTDVAAQLSDVPNSALQELYTIDLITDIVFRYQRDQWTLLDKSDVTASKLLAGGVNLFFSAVGTSPKGKPNLKQGIALTHKLVDEAGPDIQVATDFDEVSAHIKKGIVSVMILVEGATELEKATRDQLLDLKRQGVAIIGLVSGRSNGFADTAVSPLGKNGGLTKKGATFVQELRDVGIAVDLTHASPRAFYDTLVSEGILAMVSHSAVASLREHPRNLDDLQILSLARYNGILGLIFNPDFLVAGVDAKVDIDDVIDHIAYIKKMGALGCLSIGSDFAGIHPPKGLADISKHPELAIKMAGAGFTLSEIQGVFGKNAERYFENVAAKYGAAEVSGEELLRPIDLDCETVVGEVKGPPLASCDHVLLKKELFIRPGSRQKIRLRDMGRTPVMLEIFGVPDTPWQVEAQDLSGEVLVKRGVRLDEHGVGQVPLPGNKNLTRLFLNPTRPSALREAVIWGK